MYYKPTSELVFDASIILLGRGEIKYPATFNPPGNYSYLEGGLPQPPVSRFQLISSGVPPVNYTAIWSSISGLEIVSRYFAGNKKIALFLYIPSSMLEDKRDWKWIILMQK